jgi:hypothetical protein
VYVSFRKPLISFVNLITIHNSRDGSGAMVELVFISPRRSQGWIWGLQLKDIAVINANCRKLSAKCGHGVVTDIKILEPQRQESQNVLIR